MPETMVLRFRDLAGDTIPEHTALIAKYGYCWWGWWNKPEERIPRVVISAFLEKIEKAGSLQVFLLDSGNVLLYKARVVAINVAPTERPVPCPEPEKTPEYYRIRNWKMWFKMDSIAVVEDGDDEIRNWSYDEVSDLIDDPLRNEFQNKRVFSLREMLNRKHRTIYFLQPHQSQHRDLELTPALPSHPTTPFVTKPLVAHSKYVLHLSDLHFGTNKDGQRMHGFGSGKEAHDPSLAQLIAADLEKLFGDAPPAAVIVSGDLTWKAATEEYEQAHEFLRDLRSIYDLDTQQFVIIPGNHDIAWAEDAGDYDKEAKVSRAREAAEQNYRKFFRSFYGFTANEYLSVGRRLILGSYVPVDIVALNSSLLEQKHFAGYGYVSADQLANAAREMNWDTEPRGKKFRIVVTHHHLMAVSPQEEIDTFGRIYSLMLDAAQITYRLLGLNVDIILHGHMHQPFASTISKRPEGSDFPPGRNIAIHATGSAGVRRDHTGAIGKNAYSILEFEDDEIRIRVRTSSESTVGFQEHWATVLARQSDHGLVFENAGATSSAGARPR